MCANILLNQRALYCTVLSIRVWFRRKEFASGTDASRRSKFLGSHSRVDYAALTIKAEEVPQSMFGGWFEQHSNDAGVRLLDNLKRIPWQTSPFCLDNV